MKICSHVLLMDNTCSCVISYWQCFLFFSFFFYPSFLQASGSTGCRADSQHKPQRQYQVRTRLTKPWPQHSQLHQWGGWSWSGPESTPGTRSGVHRLPWYSASWSGRPRPLTCWQSQQQRQLIWRQRPRRWHPGSRWGSGLSPPGRRRSPAAHHGPSAALISRASRTGWDQRQENETGHLGHINGSMDRWRMEMCTCGLCTCPTSSSSPNIHIAYAQTKSTHHQPSNLLSTQ